MPDGGTIARKLRLEFEGAIYQVVNRGNYRSALFRDDGAKLAFLDCLGEACEKAGWEVPAWWVMSNRFHLAMGSPFRVSRLASACRVEPGAAAPFLRVMPRRQT